MITDEEKSAISASMGMNHMRRRRGGYPVISPNGYRLEAAPESSVISVTENTQLTSAADGNTYSLDAVGIYLTLPDHSGLSAGFSISIESTAAPAIVSVYTDYIGLDAVTFTGDGLTGDGVKVFTAGDTATLTYNGGGAWTATGTGTTARYVD